MNREVQDSVLSALSEYTSLTRFQMNKLEAINLVDVVNDSLSILEVVYDLEDRYNITLKSEQLIGLHTVADLICAIDQETSSSTVRI
jgi:acyl carrier protein